MTKWLKGKPAIFARGENGYVIIENVPCMKCELCGDVIFRESIAEKIDDILDGMEKIVSKIFIVDYTKIA